jgi:hypothetical protein
VTTRDGAVRLPSWLAVLVVSVAVSVGGSLIAVAYNSGAIVEGLRGLREAFEKMDTRIGHLEHAQAVQGADIAGLKARARIPETVTSATER